MAKVLIVASLLQLEAAKKLAKMLVDAGCEVEIFAAATVEELLAQMSATAGQYTTLVVLFDVPLMDPVSAEAVRLAKDKGLRAVGVRLPTALTSQNPIEIEKYASASVNLDEAQARRAIRDGESIWLDRDGSDRVGPATDRNKCKPRKRKPKAA